MDDTLRLSGYLARRAATEEELEEAKLTGSLGALALALELALRSRCAHRARRPRSSKRLRKPSWASTSSARR